MQHFFVCAVCVFLGEPLIIKQAPQKPNGSLLKTHQDKPNWGAKVHFEYSSKRTGTQLAIQQLSLCSAKSMTIIYLKKEGRQARVVYLCSSLLQLAPGSRDTIS